MHNVNVDAVEQTAAKATADPAAVVQHVSFDGQWQTTGPQFRADIPVPSGAAVLFEADFPPPMGGTGSAPNPLAYCFWGGLACYAMTYAQEAARRGIELRGLRARVDADVDLSRALGVTDQPPVQHIDWQLDVDAACGHSGASHTTCPRGAAPGEAELEHGVTAAHFAPGAADAASRRLV